MAKNTKKNLRLRKQIRRTMGIICLITAIVVAAIPVPEARAEEDAEGRIRGTKYTWDDDASKNIPVVSDTDKIYTTGDGTFQFAYKEETGIGVAIILGYNGRNLVNNYLEIPDEVNAYAKRNSNQGSFEGYVAVSKSNEYLFYAKYKEVEKLDENGEKVLDADGEVVMETVIDEYRPCYYNDRNSWQDLDLGEFFYFNETKQEFEATETEEHQWIKNIKVFYIGNQTIEAVENTSGSGENTSGTRKETAVRGWEIVEEDGQINTDPLKGIFANNTNIKTLVIGDYLKGIGNWAFYACGGLDTVTFGNGLAEIGKYAFADCINLKQVNIPFLSNITYISDHAFQNCQALSSFVLPASVQYIYDHAFDGCWALSRLDIAGESAGANVNLKDIGYYAFKGCTSLQNITIPASFTGENNDYKLILNNFEYCSNLRSITIQTAPAALNSEIAPTPTTAYGGDNYTVEKFKSDVHSTFYFECVYPSLTYDFTKKNAIAFKYAGEDKYEKTVEGVLYQVNSLNQLMYVEILDGDINEIDMPTEIGPYGISEINEGSFSGNCSLEKIKIPSTVVAINANAFKGCHNLHHVIFENAANIQRLGEGAFDVQVVSLHSPKCDKIMDSVPSLTFTGAVGSNIVPFRYAMSADGNINAGSQPITYITYYSGWPTNLEIEYNKDNGRAELVDYPTRSELVGGTKYTEANYPYMSLEYVDAAKEAFSDYDDYINKKPGVIITQDQWDIINSALYVTLPQGITGLKSGLFTKHGENKTPDTQIKSITMSSIEEFEPYTFDGCSNLDTIKITGGAEIIAEKAFAFSYTGDGNGSVSKLANFVMTSGGTGIGDYAFENNPLLTSVTISPEVTELGLRPFKDCTALTDVSFSGGPYFTCEESIVYKKDDGVKVGIVQCLETRSKTINAKELVGIKELADEAFEDCEKLGSIDLSQSYIERIPYHAFANTTNLFEAILPSTCKSISDQAFTGSNVQFVEIPSSVTYIAPGAFDTNNSDKIIEFFCEPGSAAETYANEYENIVISERDVEKYFTVTFWDYVTASGAPSDTLSIVKEQTVLWHTAATAPEPAGREGYRFMGWSLDFSDVSRDMDVQAMYEKIDSEETKYTVTFIDWNDKVLYTQTVAPGENAITPQNPSRQGYTFTGWRPAITNVQSDITTYAQYEYGTWIDTNGDGIPDKVVDDNTGGGNGNTGGNGGTGGNGTSSSTLYTLTVKNGSGSGSYAAGAQVPVIANEPVAGQKFDKWISENPAATFISSSVGATFMVMPAANVTIEATYKKDPNYNGGTGNNGSGNGNTNVPGSTTKPGTIIVIDKNGLSNTGVVSGTVYGSSDNFVIKISEDKDATEEVLKALLNEFGTVENLKYFPMDISLYDSTGKTKITDTSGLSIKITLPLPDSMIKYAGNNKVAGVVHERLDKLSTRFATIDGVPCVTFTAEHFSPYVIYVDVSDLSSSGTVDESPKTGDIHPKWFFVIGLGCIGIFLFLKRDKKEKVIVA